MTRLRPLFVRLGDLLTCRHRRTTFPQNVGKSSERYVVCLDCGKEFAYSWEHMRRLNRAPREA